MKSLKLHFAMLATVLLFCASCDQKKAETTHIATLTTDETEASYPNLDEVSLPGATVLAFGPENVLFVGDSKTATVHAIATQAQELKDPVPYNMKGIDDKIAAKLGIKPKNVIINDMKIHPVSQEAYIAVKRGYKPDAKSHIVIINPATGAVRLLELSKGKHTKVKLTNPVTKDYMFWKDIPASSLNITDIDYHNGHIYVAGLTNGEFASNLRKIAYPFKGNQTTVGSIEMYHPVHTQKETRAPIRTMLFEDVDGKSTLIASYTCTPLVTIPASKISRGANIKAKTIAELGYGNAPIDMLTFMTQEMDGSYDKKLLITHKDRSGSLISMKDLATANKGNGMEGITTMGPEGMKIFPVPTSGIMHIDDQNQMMIAMLRRNIDNGAVDLLSELKGSYFRLSDFIAEYNFPDYKYSAAQQPTKQFHDMVKPLEGYPELTSDKTGQ